MLVVKILVNLKELDEIHIINTGHVAGKPDSTIRIYRIVKPEILEPIIHDRKDGWLPLVQKVLEVIKNNSLEDEGDESPARHVGESQCESGQDCQNKGG